MTVIRWIESDQRQYKPLVRNRIAQILETTSETYWNYVPTMENVVDDATRARDPTFNPESRWIRGLRFLYNDESNNNSSQKPRYYCTRRRPPS